VTTFRYHVVSLLAVLLALAAGIALGGGPLSEVGRAEGATDGGSASRTAALSDELDAATAASGFQDEVTAGLTRAAVGDVLSRRPVAMVVMPGASKDVVSGLAGAVEDAGGSVSGQYAVRPALLAPDGKSLVDTLGAQVAESVANSDVPAEATTYDRMGQLIGRAVATTVNTGEEADGAGSDILSSLRGAKLMSAPAEPGLRGSLVLIVLGDEPENTDGADNIYGGLVSGIAARADGVVVTGSTASATGGLLGILREDTTFADAVSSVDSDQSAAGRLVTMLALGREKTGGSGHYGAAGADGAMPRD
jgi:hypothetical protein